MLSIYNNDIKMSKYKKININEYIKNVINFSLKDDIIYEIVYKNKTYYHKIDYNVKILEIQRLPYNTHNKIKKLICYNININKNDNLISKTNIGSDDEINCKLEWKKCDNNCLYLEKNQAEDVINNNLEDEFLNVFKIVKQERNNAIIKNKINIKVLKEKHFMDQMFNICIGNICKYSKNNNLIRDLIHYAMHYEIFPSDDNDVDYKNLSIEEYIYKLDNLNVEIFNDDILYVKKYLEFIFKSYNLAYNGKIYISKKDNDIINCFINKNKFSSNIN